MRVIVTFCVRLLTPAQRDFSTGRLKCLVPLISGVRSPAARAPDTHAAVQFDHGSMAAAGHIDNNTFIFGITITPTYRVITQTMRGNDNKRCAAEFNNK